MSADILQRGGVGRQDVDHAVSVHCLHEVLDVEHGLAKELLGQFVDGLANGL